MRGIVEYGGIDAASGRYVYRFNTPGFAACTTTLAASRAGRCSQASAYSFKLCSSSVDETAGFAGCFASLKLVLA